MTRVLQNVAITLLLLSVIVTSAFSGNTPPPPQADPAVIALTNRVRALEFESIKTQDDLRLLTGDFSKISNFGASLAIETPVALFETSLANQITDSATSMTLTSATTKDGSTLASSTYSFIIDEGKPTEEFVKADCTATACTNMTRGISVLTGTTSITALKKDHRRGASVKITDGPILINLRHIINGSGNFPNILTYESTVATTSFSAGSQQIPTIAYVDFVGSSGCANASETARGCVELATGLEGASSTSAGATGARLVLPASIATSSPGTTGLFIVMTQNNGKIASSFTDLTATYAWTGFHTFSSATTTFNATTSSPLGIVHFGNGNFATTTAGGTINGITLPVPVSLATTTSRAVAMDGNDITTMDNFFGFAVSNSTNGNELVVQTEGIVPGFSGLTIGRRYYVQDAVGTIGTTAGTYDFFVGIAASSTALLIDRDEEGGYIGSMALTQVAADTTTCAATATTSPLTRTVVIDGLARDSASSGTGQATFTLKRGASGSTNSDQAGSATGVKITGSFSTSNIAQIDGVFSSGGGAGTCSGTVYMYR